MRRRRGAGRARLKNRIARANTLCELGAAHCEALRFVEGQASVEKALALNPKYADAHYWLGICLEREGDKPGAEKHFMAAHRLDPDVYLHPFRLSQVEFEAAVESALLGLPESFRSQLTNLQILTQELPDLDLLSVSGEDEPTSPTILGLYSGSSPPSLSTGEPYRLPSVIFLFQRNIERVSANREQLLHEIRTTLLHEIGHYLGLDEDDLSERGLD